MTETTPTTRIAASAEQIEFLAEQLDALVGQVTMAPVPWAAASHGRKQHRRGQAGELLNTLLNMPNAAG